jgi:CheY-like chemotaxis protein
VTMALNGNHQVVLMDIQMPKMDGYEAVTKLRSNGYNQPIIALTARALREERERCISIGCDDCLTKPVNRAELISRVSELAH